jgi:hypothetical protein
MNSIRSSEYEIPKTPFQLGNMPLKRNVSTLAPSSTVSVHVSPKKIKRPPVKGAQDQSLDSGLIFEVRLHKCKEGIQLYSVVSNQNTSDQFLRDIIDEIPWGHSADVSSLPRQYNLRGDVARRNNDPMRNACNRFERKFFVQHAPGENDIFFRKTAFAIIEVSFAIYILIGSLLLLTHLFTYC